MGTRGRMRFDTVGVATALIRIILVGSSITNLVIKVLRTRNRNMTRTQINDTFLFQNRVKVKVVGEESEK